MAEGKKSFILYCDLIHTVNKLPDEKAGQLLKLILSYTNDLNPVIDDYILELVFEPIKHQLKRDLDGYKKKLEEKTWAGILGNMKRWHVDLYEQVIKDELTIQDAYKIYLTRKPSGSDQQRQAESQTSQTLANIAVNDNVNVTDTVTVNESVSEIKQPPPDSENQFKFPVGKSQNKPTDWNELREFVKTKSQNIGLTPPMVEMLTKEIVDHYADFDRVWRRADQQPILNWQKQIGTQWLTDLKIQEFKNKYLKLHPQQMVASMPKTRN
jgi:hypothetical protein